jgi:hypothetical protein
MHRCWAFIGLAAPLTAMINPDFADGEHALHQPHLDNENVEDKQ